MATEQEAPLGVGSVSVESRDCWQASELFVHLVGGRWVLPILRALSEKGSRFYGLLDSLDGVSRKVLTDTLRRAERDGLVRRRVDASHIETATLYELTDLGHSLADPLAAVGIWIEANWDTVEAARSDWERRDDA